MTSTTHTASAILALINSKPASPRLEEIQAVLDGGPASGSALPPPRAWALTRIGRAASALIDQHIVLSMDQCEREPGERSKDLHAQVDQGYRDLRALEDQIPFPPGCLCDLHDLALIAFHGADKNDWQRLGEPPDASLMTALGDGDCFDRPAARLIRAVLHLAQRTAT